MLSAITKAFGQLTDHGTRRLLWWSLLATAVLFAGLVALAWVGLEQTRVFDISFLNTLLNLLGGVTAVVLALALFPGVAMLALGFFLEDVAARVEARHYPQLGPARRPSLIETVAVTLRFAAITVTLNLIALPVYVILLFVPPLNLFVFYGLNGYLLGREYFELVALRRMDAKTVATIRRSHAGRLFLAGGLIALLSSLPLVNLLTPVVATAFMVHLFEDLRRGAGPSPAPASAAG